jgi:hypothetical protein
MPLKTMEKPKKDFFAELSEKIRARLLQTKKQGDMKATRTQAPINLAGKDMRPFLACAKRLGECLDRGALDRWA